MDPPAGSQRNAGYWLMGRVRCEEEMKYHRLYLLILAAIGLPIALLAVLLVVPAVQDDPLAAAVLVIPVVLIAWAVILAFRLGPDANASSRAGSQLLLFYSCTGLVSVWASTWPLARDGHSGQIFSPATTVVVAVLFSLPITHLMLVRRRNRGAPN